MRNVFFELSKQHQLYCVVSNYRQTTDTLFKDYNYKEQKGRRDRATPALQIG